MTVVGVLLFSLLGRMEGVEGAVSAGAAAHAVYYDHAFALATLRNVAATVLSFVLFWRV